MSTEISRPTIALAGGGHANLHALQRTGELTRRGFDVVLVDPAEHLHYSGMATGVLSGSYEPGENRIDLRRLVERGGGRFVRGSVATVLYRDRLLLLEDGRTVRYDAVSFCLGSETRGDVDGAVPVKPVSNLERVRERLLAAEPGGVSRIAIVGGGAAGCEVAVNLAALSREAGSGVQITLVEAAPDLLPASPKTARRIMRGRLGDLGVGVILGQRAVAQYGGAVLEDGGEIRADLALAATGVAPPDVFARSGLATGDDGALWVDRHLQSPNDPRIFGGGDAVALRGGRLPQFGVYAVRQGPVLYHNLQAVLRGEPLSSYRPQGRYLYVLDLGDGTGLAIYGPLTNRSRPALWLKHLIDRRFVREYSQGNEGARSPDDAEFAQTRRCGRGRHRRRDPSADPCAEVFDLALAHYGYRLDEADRGRAVFYACCKLLEDVTCGVRTPGAARYAEAGPAHLTRTFA